ncbi:MAG TPA: hypothetical protein VIN77_07410, partial [Aurantimonas sp.]
IHIEGGVPEEWEARLLEIADKCPVHRTLEASSTVTTKLVDADAAANGAAATGAPPETSAGT